MIRAHEIPSDRKGEVALLGGGVNPELAESIAESLGVPLFDVELKAHANGERYARIEQSVRDKDVFVVQSHAGDNGYRIEEALNEHLFLVNAAAGSSARSVTAIAPYLIHSRADRKARGRESVNAPLVIQFFEAAGAKTRFSMMSVDVHSPQTTGHLRTGSYEHLTAHPELRRAIVNDLGDSALSSCIVVAPDAGGMKLNNRHAKELTKGLRRGAGSDSASVRAIFLDKERLEEDSTALSRSVDKLEGVEGKICLVFDDMIDGGGTVISAADILMESGASEVIIAATHPIFSGDAAEKLAQSAISRVYVTDTLPVQSAQSTMGDKLRKVPVGPLIGRAVYEIMTKGSISEIFDDQNHR